MGLLPNIANYLPEKEGFCRPDWEGITNLIESQLSDSIWQEAYAEAERIWVKRLQQTLGPPYLIAETQNFLILGAFESSEMHSFKDQCESALKQISDHLLNGELPPNPGKHVVLIFANDADYYSYVSYHYPEDGTYPMSGGLCLSDWGDVHYAFPRSEEAELDTVLVHELTHGCVACFPIPSWLNEALAMRMEEVICASQVFYLDRELLKRHRSHWNAETIQQFWTGESWTIPGDSFELSYNLAQILWRKIEIDLAATKKEIVHLLEASDRNDAGESAFQKTFEMSLGELITDFLGEGSWTPHRSPAQ
jgi:hypothetical protein